MKILIVNIFFQKYKKMKIVFLYVGKTNEKYLTQGISLYQNRLNHYTSFEMIEIPNIKKSQNLTKLELMKKEGRFDTKEY